MALWDKQAKRWADIGPPLRPSCVDIQNHNSWIQTLTISPQKPLSVLLLGVTPELVKMDWPEGTRLLAIDNNFSMISTVLPSETSTLQPLGMVGDWLQLPLAKASIDLVIGDGCYSTLAAMDYSKLTTEIHRVLKPTGMFIMRFFIRPERRESIEGIQQDFYAEKIPNFHVLKWRLAMALHGSLAEGVCLDEIWHTWNALFKQNHAAIFEKLAWSSQVMQTIDNYKGVKAYYTFPTLGEIRSVIHQYFDESDMFVPDYLLGERCPTLKLIPIISE